MPEVCGKCDEVYVEGDGSRHYVDSDVAHSIVCNVPGCGTKTTFYCTHTDGTETLTCPNEHHQTVRRTPI